MYWHSFRDEKQLKKTIAKEESHDGVKLFRAIEGGVEKKDLYSENRKNW